MAKSDLVQVSPQEFIRRKPGESDADVRKRWAAEQKALDAKIARQQEDSRFYKKRGETSDIGTRIGMDIARMLGKKYANGGKVTRGDGIAKKGRTKGKMV